MASVSDSVSKGHTLVCDGPEVAAQQMHRSEAFLALIRHHVDRQARSLTELAGLLGISRRQLGRILSGQRRMRLGELDVLTDLLKIDRTRAAVAIEVIEDWRSYDDPALCILIGMLKPVVTKIQERADFPIEPLTETALETLTNWLADSIIANEKQIRSRRNAFIKLPEL